MKITICGSSAFRDVKLGYKKKLTELGHQAFMHPDYEAFARGEKQDIMRQVLEGEHAQVKISQGYIMWYYNSILKSDAILVVNLDKKGIPNYIGGNTLMELGFAYVNNKKIFLLNPIPEEVSYTDEIKAVQPIILNGDLSKLE